MVNGYDFADVIAAYCRGFEDGNEQLKADAVRWLRGEFSTKTDARAALGVRTIVDDASVYDQLKLLARFVRLAGYRWLDGLPRRTGEPVQAGQYAGTQLQLRADSPHPERLATGVGRRAGICAWRNARVSHRHPPGPLQLHRATIAGWPKTHLPRLGWSTIPGP